VITENFASQFTRGFFIWFKNFACNLSHEEFQGFTRSAAAECVVENCSAKDYVGASDDPALVAARGAERERRARTQCYLAAAVAHDARGAT
jgi:hypothetical protein